MKYIFVRICPVRMYGSSACRAPIPVTRITVFVIVQNSFYLVDGAELCSPKFLFVCWYDE